MTECKNFKCEYCGYESTVTNICRRCDRRGLLLVLQNSLKDGYEFPKDVDFFSPIYFNWLIKNSKITQQQAEKIWEQIRHNFKIDVWMICKEHGVKGH